MTKVKVITAANVFVLVAGTKNKLLFTKAITFGKGV